MGLLVRAGSAGESRDRTPSPDPSLRKLPRSHRQRSSSSLQAHDRDDAQSGLLAAITVAGASGTAGAGVGAGLGAAAGAAVAGTAFAAAFGAGLGRLAPKPNE